MRTIQFKDAIERANNLISTSVHDLESSLPYYEAARPSDVQVIRIALLKCQKRGEKTKATILHRKLRKMEKQISSMEAKLL